MTPVRVDPVTDADVGVVRKWLEAQPQRQKARLALRVLDDAREDAQRREASVFVSRDNYDRLHARIRAIEVEQFAKQNYELARQLRNALRGAES